MHPNFLLKPELSSKPKLNKGEDTRKIRDQTLPLNLKGDLEEVEDNLQLVGRVLSEQEYSTNEVQQSLYQVGPLLSLFHVQNLNAKNTFLIKLESKHDKRIILDGTP